MVDTNVYDAEDGAEAVEARPSAPDAPEQRHEAAQGDTLGEINAKLDLLLSAQGIDYDSEGGI